MKEAAAVRGDDLPILEVELEEVETRASDGRVLRSRLANVLKEIGHDLHYGLIGGAIASLPDAAEDVHFRLPKADAAVLRAALKRVEGTEARSIPPPPEPLPHQLPPEGDWKIWMIRGGRGSGKTWAAAHFIAGEAASRRMDIALLGDVASIIEGSSGLRAFAPEAQWRHGHGRLVWPNGSVGYVFSSGNPDYVMRAHRFDLAWLDEPQALSLSPMVWDLLKSRLLPNAGRMVITQSPTWLELLQESGRTVVTQPNAPPIDLADLAVRARPV